MFNRTKELQNDLSNTSGKKVQIDTHPVVGWYELYAVVIAIPSMLIFALSFLFAVGNVYVAKFIAKGRKRTALILLFLINLPYAPAAMLMNHMYSDAPKWSFGVIMIVPLSLLIFGFIAIHLNFKGREQHDL
ncbi:hypothetical protein [Alteromonas flava]|uniref:hypothetical protein n=1 Tax=Alteromonas flava TaxID=2048003 RepID=UPI000C289EAD|nr:hypothetical protein [Alteromonas flava]